MSPSSERRIVFLVGAIQFVNILDFMLVMPLGPDFARELGIPGSHLGYIGGSYTASAAVSGLIGSFFLDRFDRRRALFVAMLGLVIGTAAGGLATGLNSLMMARVIAGAFGGPATSLSYAIIADVIPPERRGKAMGAVMGAFSAASVLGVPAALELSRLGGWRLPFFSVAAAGLIVGVSCVFLLPPLRGHLEAAKVRGREVDLLELLSRPTILISYLMTAVLMLSVFVLVPNISPYLQFNLGYPRERLGLLYLFGGTASFFATRGAGALVDRYGAFVVGTSGALLVVLVVYGGFYADPPHVSVLTMFVGFMVSTSFRAVPYNALISKVPEPHERARFMSIQSAVQHLAAAAGGFLSASMLTELPDHRLVGIKAVSLVTIALHFALPAFFYSLQARVDRRRVLTLAEGGPSSPG